MSVIHFGEQELGNIASVIARRRGHPGMADFANSLRLAAFNLAEYSKANARAYNATYGARLGGRAVPVDQESIVQAGMREGEARSLAKALSTAALLRYNAMANNGRCFMTKAAALAVAEILGSLAYAAADRLEPPGYARWAAP
jgi:hypothetical protein